MPNSALIYCFTGTGNALRLSRAAAGAFENRGVRAEIVLIEEGRFHPAHGEAEYTGFVTPVLGFGLPQMTARFLRRLPRGDGRKSFVLIAMGNAETLRFGPRKMRIPPYEGIALIQALYRLRVKGYAALRGAALEMPTNWILAVNPPDGDRARALADAAAQAAADEIARLIRGERTRPQLRLILAIPCALVYCLFVFAGRRIAGKWFTAGARCDGCMQCAAQCPQRTISRRRNRPYWGWDCQQCFRCINLCPRGAIEVSALSVAASCAPLFFSGRLFRHLWPIVAGEPLGCAARFLWYLLLTGAAAWLLHFLYALPPASGAMPRWYLTGRRRRYRAAGFAPPWRSRDT